MPASVFERRLFGYHPILATRADTREALHTQQAIKRFCEELIARVERAGATGPQLLRADSGFWNTKVFELLEKAGWSCPASAGGIGLRNGSWALRGRLSRRGCAATWRRP